ncbi:aminotransferase class I/II-fold pyridoxal phosphate-dependent enzyme [Campylobacter sp. FMV-PI01]|uniref:Aminotransferase class I/II-fold pyridoxal phosphate-dependent enzyme n=1 Tax=Campylobacter portucalensis TaxID=2608384 RepID=A0A6L5WG54_9BACT|nr:aminotransferase class I/II-fold pyridoxal phosphate-dependent enzyme [Campylobacter portucalensis]MSN96004.1 aminotransferase class I/II-fold pyridoxal phosphate-dependent enzyme [Campylobacter portucalensis]
MQKETLATHAGYDSKFGHGSMAVPIYFSTAYDFGSAEVAADRFALRSLGQIYSRLTNPTVDVFEARMAALEDGAAGIATSSGQAAIFSAVVNLAGVGDNIIVAEQIYGGATTLLTHTIKRFGIKAKIFDSQNPSNLDGLIDENTKAIFFETLSNPQISVANVDEIVKIAQKYNVITIADNTVATPILYNPLKDGVDVVIHSASKYISGQGLSLGGVIISNKNLNSKLKSNPRYPHFNEPDESYHGLVYTDLIDNFDIYTLRLRLTVLRDIGVSISPFNAFQLIQGLETLSIRVEKHSQNALKVANFLKNHPKVKKVNYPGFDNRFVKDKFKDGLASGLLSFEVSDFESAKKIVNSTKIFSVVVNIGDSKSIITHPASTTHSQLNQDELDRVGINQGLIRLSVGLESADDLIADLEAALK